MLTLKGQDLVINESYDLYVPNFGDGFVRKIKWERLSYLGFELEEALEKLVYDFLKMQSKKRREKIGDHLFFRERHHNLEKEMCS